VCVHVCRHLDHSFPVDLSPARMASTSSAINFIISQLGSADHHTCLKAAKQVSTPGARVREGVGLLHQTG